MLCPTKKTMSGSCLAIGIAAQMCEDPPARVIKALKHCARLKACQPIAAQVASMGKCPPKFTPTPTRTTTAAATPTPTSNATTKTRQAAARKTERTPYAVRQSNPLPPRKGRSTNPNPFNHQRHFRKLYQAPSAHLPRNVCVSVPVNTAHAGDRPPKSGRAQGFHVIKGPLKRADGRSKPATPRSALCAFLHHGLVPIVCCGTPPRHTVSR